MKRKKSPALAHMQQNPECAHSVLSDAHMCGHRGAPGVQDDVHALLRWRFQRLKGSAPSNDALDSLLSCLAKQTGRGKHAVEVLREASQVLSKIPNAW